MAEGSRGAQQEERAGEPARGEGQNKPPQGARPGHIYAALDLGTNNCRLLIAKPEPGGFRVLDSFSRTVRLDVWLKSKRAMSALPLLVIGR